MVNLFCFICQKGSLKRSINTNDINAIKDKTFPPYVLKLIYSHLDNSGSKGLYSCLLVNRHWHSNVLPILWKCPFTSKPLSQKNSIKLIETLLLCLDSTAKQSLKTSLKQQKLKLVIPNKSPLFNYASLLGELDYKEFEKSINSYLIDSFTNNNNNFIVRRLSSMEPPSLKHIHPIAENLFTLFARQSSVFESLIIDKFSDNFDLPLTKAQLQSKPNNLSRITKLHLDYYESGNMSEFLKLLPTLCNDLLEFTVKICDFENETLINQSIADVVTSQHALRKLSIDGARNGGNVILVALGDSQSNTLLSARFKLMNFKSTGMKSLVKCRRLKELSLENCQGLSVEITKILFDAKLQHLKRFVIWNNRKMPTVTSVMIKSTIHSKLKELALDTIIIGTVNVMLESCPNITSLKIFNYHPKRNLQMFRLLRGLPHLERLTICKETKVESGVINFSGKYLPNNINYLRLECGVSPNQLDNLLKGLGSRSNLKTLIIDYFKLEASHLKIIVEWTKTRKLLKFLGIGGKSEFSGDELAELNILQDECDVFIIPSYKLDYY